MSKLNFLDQINQGTILLADGATGTNLQKRGLPVGVPPEKWIMDRPEEVFRLYKDFIQAGSDIILTCTFGGSRIRLEQNDLAEKAAEINKKAVDLAHKASHGSNAFIAGSLGPLGELLQPLGNIDEGQAEQYYYEQAGYLDSAGVDFLLIETQFDINEAQAAVRGVKSASKLPVVVSFSFDRGVRTMMGVKPEQVAEIFPNLGVHAIGINCGKSPADNLKVLEIMKNSTSLPIWYKPNAGFPKMDSDNIPYYDLEPLEMAKDATTWVQIGANIIGGCCGTTPDHIREIAALIKKN